jgi:tetratricopeptide (TPR) repeat protein
MVVGIGLESNGLIERSRALERKAYEMFPSDPRILNNYAAGLCSQGKENEAMSIYSRLFNQYPYYTQPLKQVYQLLLRQKNTEMAGKVLQRIYEVYREAPSFLTGRYSTGEIASYVSAYADVLGSRGEWKRELPVCSTLVQIDNKQPQYPAMLAECLLELGDNDGAIARCRDVVTRWPAYPYGYYVGAEALKRKGLADDAVEMLRQCSRAAPVQAQITGILPSTRATQR